jgi:2-polyprenyl-3-methyl-5-hydroxy-6-metoxy-1,4-benzoquinol methylase
MPQCVKNIYGFYELAQKPSYDELSEYYSEKYYQENKATYSKEYSEEEKKYFLNKIGQKFHLIKKKLGNLERRSLLDVGCGEGFTLKYFEDLGWDVHGVDFNNYGCKIHNPQCVNKIATGDIYDVLHRMKLGEQRFDLLWLDNILEHVLNPLDLLKLCRDLGNETSFLIVEVPNDFSALQRKALELKLIDREFWIAVPDHISYFNKEGLIKISRKAGWKLEVLVGDFPIDFNLFNENSNYVKDRSKGKAAHKQRYVLENLLHSISIEKVNKFYEVLGDLGLGRQIIALFRKA